MILGHTEGNNDIRATGSLKFPTAFEAEESYIHTERTNLSFRYSHLYLSGRMRDISLLR